MRVTLSDPPITAAHAEILLHDLIRRVYLPAVMRLCPGADTDGRIAAIPDLCFDIGAGALKSSTLRKRIAAGMWDDVPNQFRRWNRAAGGFCAAWF